MSHLSSPPTPTCLTDATTTDQTPRTRWLRCAGHVLAAIVVAAGATALLTQPTAPEIGATLPATTWFDEATIERADAIHVVSDVMTALAAAITAAFAVVLGFTRTGRWAVRSVTRRLRREWLAAGLVAGGALLTLDMLLAPTAFVSQFVYQTNSGWTFEPLREGAVECAHFGDWLRQWAASRAPRWVTAAVMAAIGYGLAARWPRGWVPSLALLAAGSALLMAYSLPLGPGAASLRSSPMHAGPTRDAVLDVVDAADGGIAEPVVVDSGHGSHQNAYALGFADRRRVLLYDTLVQERAPDEVAAVAAHEVAHHLHRDIERATLAWAAASTVAVYGIAGLLRLRVRTGQQRRVADPDAVGLLVGVLLLTSLIAQPVESALSRRMETAADWGALQLLNDADAYERSKVALALANRSRPDPPRWRYLWDSTHPSPVERLMLAEEWRADRARPPSAAAEPVPR